MEKSPGTLAESASASTTYQGKQIMRVQRQKWIQLDPLASPTPGLAVFQSHTCQDARTFREETVPANHSTVSVIL